jgi:hypothetical protein
MLSGCLNQSCGAPYHYHSEGRVFTIERVLPGGTDADPRHEMEHYWLCGSCCTKLKVIVENGEVKLVPIEPDPLDARMAISLGAPQASAIHG